MNVLLIGDIVGKPGRNIVVKHLPGLIAQHKVDLCIANVENAAGGFGITPPIAQDFFQLGIDILTSGNHIWDRKEIVEYLPRETRLLRPANYPRGVPGRGSIVHRVNNGHRVGILNLSGRIFMQPLDCPFVTADNEIKNFNEQGINTIIVDMHAEATSEKIAMGWFLENRASVVAGTHTHVQTADDRILPGGTAYITDLGMTGSHESVIGLKKDLILKRFMTQMPIHYEVSKKDVQLCGALINIDESTGKAVAIDRIRQPL